jgi:hypothetical protein
MRTRQVLLAATLLAAAAGGVAVAQDAATATYDPAQLPATHGKVAQYSLTPRGDVDGLILSDGTEVHLPPHLGPQLVFAVKPGDTVTVRGLRARAVPMVQAMSVANDASGATVTDTGPPAVHGPRDAAAQPLSAQGTVKAALHGPRGELNGALLEDGTIVRLPPPEATRVAALLAPGKTLAVQGDGVAGPLGRVIAARAIGSGPNDMAPVAVPPPPHGHGHHPGPGGDGPPPPPR